MEDTGECFDYDFLNGLKCILRYLFNSPHCDGEDGMPFKHRNLIICYGKRFRCDKF